MKLNIRSCADLGRRRLLHAGGALALLPILAACGGEQTTFNSTNVTGADIGKGWSLPDLDGVMRSADDYTGKVAVVFFGFIQCPDVCPTTLMQLTQVKEKLGADGDRMQVLFITVDPERDTPEIVRAYLDGFDPAFSGLRGSPEQLAQAAKSFKTFYAKAPLGDDGGYTMEHSAGLYLFDTKGQVRLYASQIASADALASDIRNLL